MCGGQVTKIVWQECNSRKGITKSREGVNFCRSFIQVGILHGWKETIWIILFRSSAGYQQREAEDTGNTL
jgi:hypothetical protein